MAKVLLADDLAFIKMVQQEVLKDNGFEVVGDAVDGVDCVEKYKKLRPDIVIMDITMPRMDGLNALRAILSQDKKARVVICSALGQQKLIIEAIKAGAKDFIVKPFQPERLLSALHKAMK